MANLGWAAGVALGLIFLAAGAGKLRRPAAFRTALSLMRTVPRGTAPVLAWAIPILEILLGAALVAGIVPRLAATAAAVLLIAFVVAIVPLLDEAKVPCNCFGTGDGELDRGTIARDLALLVMSILVVVAAPPDAPSIGPAIVSVTALLVLPFAIGRIATLWVEARRLWDEPKDHIVWRPSIR